MSTRVAKHSMLQLLLIVLLAGGAISTAFAQRVKVACIGNSVTAGYLLPDPASQSYPSRLQHRLGNGFEVRNFGHSGATLMRNGHRPYAQMPEFAQALAFKPDVAIIDLGLNDTDPRDWPEHRDDFKKDYSWLIDTLRKTNPTIKVYVCLMTPIFHTHPRFKSGTREWFWQIQALIPAIAVANHATLIDVHTPLYPHPDWFPDALHPDVNGADVLAKTIYGVVSGDYGGLQVPTIFSDSMVLQREKLIPVFGTANAGTRVKVTLGNNSREVVSGNNGQWKVWLPAMLAGGHFTLRVNAGANTQQFKNVLIGDVWLCAGQSNMDFPLRKEKHFAEASNKRDTTRPLRFYHMQGIAPTDDYAWNDTVLAKTNALDFFSANWQGATASDDFSAIGYYFGQALEHDQHVPIGLIQLSVGGSPLAAWIDRYTMEHDATLVDVLYNWRNADFLQSWVRTRTDVNLQHAENPLQRHSYEPCYEYEAGISRLVQTPIKGVIWYQGESDAHNPELYEKMMPVMVKSWREKWNDAFPFYYVQLSGLDRPSWPTFRDVQRKLLAEIPNSGMVVSSDVGEKNNVHPVEKRLVAERLARLALARTYHRTGISPVGSPLPLRLVRKGAVITVFFSDAKNLRSADRQALRGFALINDKGELIPVHAVAVGATIRISIPAQQKVNTLVYAWDAFPDANLVNEAGLPASTFKMSLTD